MKGYSQSSLGSVRVPPAMRRMYERVIFFFFLSFKSDQWSPLVSCSTRISVLTNVVYLWSLPMFIIHRGVGPGSYFLDMVQSKTVLINFVLPRYGTKRTTWFHRRRTELFLSQPMLLLRPTRLGESVRRYELLINNIKNDGYEVLRFVLFNFTTIIDIMNTRPVHKNLFLEFPKYPGRFMLHFDI